MSKESGVKEAILIEGAYVNSMTIFRDRSDAGEQLADLLSHLEKEKPVVLGLPRGGVPVAARVAERLHVPLGILVSRKLGVPSQPELGFGAISEGGALWIDRGTTSLLGLTPETIEEIAFAEQRELLRRVSVYRGGAPLQDLEGKTVILVDDGVATGGTLRAAIRAARGLGAGRLVAAVPVAASDTAAELQDEVDEWVCVQAPDFLWAIGSWYESFPQLRDEEVLRWLERYGAGTRAGEEREAVAEGESLPPGEGP